MLGDLLNVSAMLAAKFHRWSRDCIGFGRYVNVYLLRGSVIAIYIAGKITAMKINSISGEMRSNVPFARHCEIS